jgi:hypothetical protein
MWTMPECTSLDWQVPGIHQEPKTNRSLVLISLDHFVGQVWIYNEGVEVNTTTSTLTPCSLAREGASLWRGMKYPNP